MAIAPLPCPDYHLESGAAAAAARGSVGILSAGMLHARCRDSLRFASRGSRRAF